MKSAMNIVGWNAELLLKGRAGELSAKQRELVDEILKAQERLVNLMKGSF